MLLLTAIPVKGCGISPLQTLRATACGRAGEPAEVGVGTGTAADGWTSGGTLVWCVPKSNPPTTAAATNGIATAESIFVFTAQNTRQRDGRRVSRRCRGVPVL